MKTISKKNLCCVQIRRNLNILIVASKIAKFLNVIDYLVYLLKRYPAYVKILS